MSVWLVTIVFCLIAAPLFAHLRHWQPASLFALAGMFYALAAVVQILNTKTVQTSYSDTYCVVSRMHSYIGVSVVMAMFAAFAWMLERFDAMLYPRAIKTLFWVFHISILVSVLPTKWFIVTPRRYMDYPDYAERLVQISSASATIASLAFCALAGVLVWSVMQKRRANRRA